MTGINNASFLGKKNYDLWDIIFIHILENFPGNSSNIWCYVALSKHYAYIQLKKLYQ